MLKKIATVVLLLAGALAAQTLDIPKNMKSYYVVFLVAGEKATQPQAKADADALLQKHLAYIKGQIEAGKYVMAGPFTEGGRIAGMIVVNVATEQEVKRIVGADPLVQSGRTAIEIHQAMLPDLSGVRVDYSK